MQEGKELSTNLGEEHSGHKEDNGQKSWVRNLPGCLRNSSGQSGWSKTAGTEMRSEGWLRARACRAWPGLWISLHAHWAANWKVESEERDETDKFLNDHSGCCNEEIAEGAKMKTSLLSERRLLVRPRWETLTWIEWDGCHTSHRCVLNKHSFNEWNFFISWSYFQDISK